MTTLYGIKNCDTVKKARKWLDSHKIDYVFHDFRTDGLTEDQVAAWVQDLGLNVLINKRSATWNALDDIVKNNFESDAVKIIMEQPTLIKRPLLDIKGKKFVGFKDSDYNKIFINT